MSAKRRSDDRMVDGCVSVRWCVRLVRREEGDVSSEVVLGCVLLASTWHFHVSGVGFVTVAREPYYRHFSLL